MSEKNEQLDNLRHSCAHLLAAAVMDLWPKAKRTIGPSIENGFYYDFDFGEDKITEEDFLRIEKKMHEILPTWKGFDGQEVTVDQAKDEYKGNEYKLELIEEVAGKGEKLTFYKSGDYSDLCRGGHVSDPSQSLQCFKLLSVAGAYWRGSEKNPMLTRIYGTCFPTQEELDQHLEQIEEAKLRDHRKLGRELGLFMFHETSAGSPYWLPNGLVVLNQLIDFWRLEHRTRGYKEIASPLINKKELWEKSGHWEHFRNDMFVSDMGENEVYGLKPMNCPNAMVVFGSNIRSYRDLPLRLSDTDILHRYERSGTLNGLLRVRSFRQDDSHNFITEEMIPSEYAEILDIAMRFYQIFNMEYRLRLGTRPEKFLGDVATWDKAEAALKQVLQEHTKGDFEVLKGDGAFYGPKIDILMKDSLGREWQMGTVQLDFQLPERFNLKYTAQDGTEKTPVVVHRVIYGSLERFIGILIEHFGGAFPVWLSPVQVQILPISDNNLEYAQKIKTQLEQANIRVEVDNRGETLPAKIRDAQMQKTPYMIIVGGKEEESQTISVRLRTGEEQKAVKVDNFVAKTLSKISEKSLDL